MSPAPQIFLDEIDEKPPIMDDGKLVLVEVKKCEIKVGKESGNPYMNLQIEVVNDPEDEGSTMFDILVFPLEQEPGENPKAYKKRMTRRCFRLKSACTAFGISTSGSVTQEELAEMFIARQAWAAIGIEDDGSHPAKNVVKAYYHVGNKPNA